MESKELEAKIRALRTKRGKSANFDKWAAFHIDDLMALVTTEVERAIVAYRDKVSTDGRPLSAAPLMVRQPVPCPGCGAEEYADWTLYPHQLYNAYMPGGIGHNCFPCFAKLVVQPQPQKGKQV